MSYSSNGNISGNESGSQSGPIATPQSTFALTVAQASNAVGQYLVQWAEQVYAQTSAMTTAMVAQYLNLANYGTGLAKEQIQQYTGTTVPEMNQLANEAADYSSTARLSYNMGAAASDAAQNAAAANQNTLQSLRSYGVDPSSGMYGDILAAQNTAAGATEAGAAQQAQVNTENEGRTLLNQSITAGEQLPGDVVNALNSAYQGVTGAENSVLSNANTGATVMSTPAPFFNAASHITQPSTASTSQAAGGSLGGGGSKPGNNKMGNAMGGAGRGPVNPGGGPAAQTGGPGMQTTQNPYYTGPSTGVNMSDINPSGGGFNEFGGTSNPEASLANDPFNQQFTQYQGDTTNPITSSTGPGNYGMPGAGIDSSGNVPQYNANPGAGWGDFSTPSATDWSSGATNSGFGGSTNSDPAFSSGAPAFNNYGNGSPFDQGAPAFDNYGNSGGYYSSAGGGTSTGGGAAAVSASGDSGNWGAGASPVTDYGGAGSDFSGYYTFAKGGPVGQTPTTGGFVPRQASPSMGRQTDDIPARLNAGEFVIPRDVAAWKGQEFFQKLVQQSRKARVGGGAPAQGKPKPTLGGAPRFQSQSLGAR